MLTTSWILQNKKTVGVGSGGDNARNDQHGDSAGLGTGPATGVSEARVAGDAYNKNTAGLENVGRQRVEGLDGPPSDAVAGGKSNTQVRAPLACGFPDDSKLST